MISCSPGPESIFKAAVLAELTGMPARFRESGQQADLFSLSEDLDANSFDLPQLIHALEAKKQVDTAWIHLASGRRIAVMILFNLRNGTCDCEPIIFAALAEALTFGPNYCIFGRGRASALFRRRSREVGSEIHRMLGLIRFDETSDGELVARPKLFHQTADILLRKFQQRYPDRRLTFLLDDGALCCEQGRIHRIARKDLTLSVLNSRDDFSMYWETYYRSQYIPARKNIRLASHFIPKKYWDWLPEGKILEQEAKK